MGDAVRDGGDPETTIDSPARTATTTTKPEQITPDYGELLTVERRHYAVVSELAKGGIGRVVEARDLRLGRQVAIKELLPQNRDAARRFEREARITARLQHPAIIHVYEAGMWPGGEPFYAMPKVSGRSLDKVVAERASLVERLGLVPHVIAVADALAYAHNENIIHRDLKPANVLVGDFGQTVVIDWGLAKELDASIERSGSAGPRSDAERCGGAIDPKESLARFTASPPTETAAGGVVGTPAYMPAEQARGEAVDRRADVYAIGALLYKVLTGVAPYVGQTAADVLDQVRAGPPVPLDEREMGAPPELAAIVAKAMARDPDDRYATAGELARDLQRFQTGQLVAAHRYTRRQLVVRFVRRHRLALAIAAVAVAAIAIVGGVSVWRILDEKAQTEAKRFALLEERGRSELLEGRAGPALAYLVGAAHDRVHSVARGFLIAEAKRPFEAEGATLAAGTGPIAVAVTSDGEHIATGGDALRLWSEDGRPERVFSLPGRIRAVAFDPSGAHVAAAGDDGIVRIWPRGGGSPLELRGHKGAIVDLAFSSDGRRIVAASVDATARVWDAIDGRALATSTCHTGPVLSARLSPDGARIATASEDGMACVWSVQSDTLISPLHGHRGPVRSVRWSRDGTRLATAGDDGTARVWNPELGKPVVERITHDGGIVVAELSPEGDRLLTASADHTAALWTLPDAGERELPTAHLDATLVGHADAIVAAAFSDDGTLIATAGLDRLAKVWDADNGQELASFEHADVVSSLVFARSTALVTGDRDGRGHVWELRRSALGDRRELDSPVLALAAAPGGLLAAGTDDTRVTLWRGAQAVTLRGHLTRVIALGLSSDGQRLITVGEDTAPIVWDAATGQQRCVLGAPRVHAVAVWGHTAALAIPEAVELWSLDDCKPGARFADRGASIEAVAYAGLVAIGVDDGSVVLWDPATGAARAAVPMSSAIGGLAFSPGADALLVASAGDARIVDVATLADHLLDGPFGRVTAVGWLDRARVVTASEAGIAKVWDADKGKLLATRRAPGKPIRSLAIAGDALWLGDQHGSVSAWDLRVDDLGVENLDMFLASHTRWQLGPDDVPRRTSGVER